MDNDMDLQLVATGPATVGGRLPLAEVARVAGELQATLERIALGRIGSRSLPGRRPRDVVDAVRLELRGFSVGSAVLDIAPAGSAALLEHELLVGSFDDLVTGSRAMVAGELDSLPASFTPVVLDGLLRLCGGIAESSVTGIELRRSGSTLVRFDQDFREIVRSARRARNYGDATVVGRLQMGDFAPSALRCRIDTLNVSVVCDFDESMRDSVLGAMDSMVIATGVAEYADVGGSHAAMRVLAISELTVIDEGAAKTFKTLATEQDVQPVQDITDLASDDLVDDDADFDRFLAAALSARGR